MMDTPLLNDGTNSNTDEDFLYWDDTFKLEDTGPGFNSEHEKSPIRWIKLELLDENSNSSNFSSIIPQTKNSPTIKITNFDFTSQNLLQPELQESQPEIARADPCKVVSKQDAYNNSPCVYICQLCYYIFKTKKEIDRHSKLYHNGLYQFKKQRLETPPDDINPENLPKQCTECEAVFDSMDDLLKHHLTHKTFTKCVACDLQCICHAKLKEHYKIHHDKSKSFACYVCNKKFKLERYVRVHMRKKHPILDADIGEFPCNRCSFVAFTKNILESHISTHNKRLLLAGGN